ncbi:hypothetical protein Syun_021731 [Stephania yunnanensis]|uniref:Uncharacterized protein n=1 Tax=Stephania yunnanensis TaxID=152371 RepID=A0AAP0IG56_9MAGN
MFHHFGWSTTTVTTRKSQQGRRRLPQVTKSLSPPLSVSLSLSLSVLALLNGHRGGPEYHLLCLGSGPDQPCEESSVVHSARFGEKNSDRDDGVLRIAREIVWLEMRGRVEIGFISPFQSIVQQSLNLSISLSLSLSLSLPVLALLDGHRGGPEYHLLCLGSGPDQPCEETSVVHSARFGEENSDRDDGVLRIAREIV